MDRYIVACYDSEVGGHFQRHRDNENIAAQHRRFAVSINLNKYFDGLRSYLSGVRPQDLLSADGWRRRILLWRLASGHPQ